MKEKINLEEILKSYLTVEAMVLNYPDYTFNMVITAMKEACRQTLELAADNVRTEHNYYDKWDENEAYNQYKDFGFEHCDGDGIPYGIDVVTINKQSILNTINQIE